MHGGGKVGRTHKHTQPSKRPSMRDIAFAAGFFEGDGSVNANQSKGSPTVQIAQKDSEILYQLRGFFGGSVKCYTRKKDGRSYYKWWLTGKHARAFLFTIYTMLTERRKLQIRKCF